MHMDGILGTILGIGAAFFGLATLYFAWVGRKKSFNSAVIVSSVTVISYLVMLEGSLVGLSPAGDPILWTRWVGYALSCGILMYVISSRVKAPAHRSMMMVALTILVMLSGAFAAVMSGIHMWLMFVASSVLYVGLLALMYHPDHRRHLGPLHKYIWFGWTLFPVIFILAPEGIGIICALAANIGYFALDIFTKVVFYLDLERGGVSESFEK